MMSLEQYQQDQEVEYVDLKSKRGRKAFERNDNLYSFYNLTKLFFLGWLLIPLKLSIFAATLYLYWVWLVLALFLYKLGIISNAWRKKVGKACVSVGAQFMFFVFGITTTHRYYVTQEQVQDFLQNIIKIDEGKIAPSLSFKSMSAAITANESDPSALHNRQAVPPSQWKQKPPYLVISNHISFLDPAVVMHELGEASFIAKSDIKGAPVIGRLMESLQVLFTGKESKGNIIPLLIQRIREYYNDPSDNTSKLLIFPEGTTNNSSHIIKFHDGAFIPAVPIQILVFRFKFKHFNPAWLSQTVSEILYMLLLFCQLRIEMEMIHFPYYYPTEREQQNPTIFAETVRRLMAYGANLYTEKSLGRMHLSNEKFVRHLETK